jgi:hypothetical protein
MGTYTELVTSSSSFNRLLDNIHQQEQEQHEHPIDIQYRLSTRSMTASDKDIDEEMLLLTENIEMKREGTVNWYVYMSYLQAGAGLILGIFLVTFIFGIREAASVYYSWWLAKWSDDESYRYRYLNNCTDVSNPKIDTIRSMNDIQWNNYRNERFYAYCGGYIFDI